MTAPNNVFRSYDIRGKYPLEISRDDVVDLGKAIGTYLQKSACKKVVVGRDNRPNASVVANVLMEGLVSTGCQVTFTGITTQPAMHYFTFLDYDAGVNVTASHNPKEYTGFKIDFKNAVPLWGEELQQLYNLYLSRKYLEGAGKREDVDLNPQYIKMLESQFKLTNKIKVMVDCGGGATSVLTTEILKKIGVEVNDMFCNIEFGRKMEIPNPESPVLMKQVSEMVTDFGAQVGIAFDGDGDRIGVTDEKGNIINADMLLMLFASRVLKQKKGGTILYDVKSTALLEKQIPLYGGVAKMIKTGRSNFLAEMLQKKALVGAEFSGHFYFADQYFGFDDALYTACRLIQLISEEKKPLSALMEEFPRLVNTPEITIACPDDRKFEVMSEIVKNVKTSQDKLHVNYTDGVRVSISPTGWYLIRVSNTAPTLSLRAEGKDDAEVSYCLQQVAKLLTPFSFLDLSSLV